MKIEDLMTITQAAKLRGVSRLALYQAIDRGVFNPVQVGGKPMLLRNEVEAYTPIGHRPKAEQTEEVKPKRGRGRPKKEPEITDKSE